MPKSRELTLREGGFSFIEVLVVIFIVGLLVAIAVAIFANQRNKGEDVEAKQGVATATRAMVMCGNDNDGRYDKPSSPCDRAELTSLEPTLNKLGARLEEPVLGSDTFTVTVHSARAPSDVYFSIRRLASGTFEHECGVGGQDKGGCSTPGGSGEDW